VFETGTTMTEIFKPELLAPAGSEQCLYAAVENGADAVYFGLSGVGNFNARVRAQNIPLEKLGEIMTFLHQRRLRGYVTLNTLVQCDELPAIESLLREMVIHRVDAILVQDFGIAKLARKLCPGLAIHASTQMSLTSQRAVELAQSLGIQRVVLPRELSLRQIRDLRKKTTAELECFIHGALCISFSGQCYASAGLGGRSANRGCCAQPCRLAYTLVDDSSGENLLRNNTASQLLSPCDLAALPILSQLMSTGIHSLKIEGRLKPPEYVAEVTRIYRQAIDEIIESRKNKTISETNIPELITRLELTFSRGFSTGWLEGVEPHRLVPGNIMSHRGSPLGTVIEVRRDAAVVKLSAPVRRGDGVLFENETSPEHSQGGRVYEIFRRRESVKDAEAGAKVLLTFANHSINADYLAEGQTVRKTDDPKIQKEIRKNLESGQNSRSSVQRIPLEISVRAVVGEPIRVEVRCSPDTSCILIGQNVLESARKHPLTVEVLREQFHRLGETNYCLKNLEANIEGEPMIPLSVLGSLRREMIEKLNLNSQNNPNESMVNVPNSETPTLPDNVLQTLRNENVECDESQTVEIQTPESSTRQESPVLHFLLRDVRLFENDSFLEQIIETGCRSIYAELREMDEFQIAANAVRKHGIEFVTVLPRILKPGESGILKKFAALEPDAVLARNLDEIAFFCERNRTQNSTRETIIVADFSLNVINDLSFRQLLEWGANRITLGWDIDETRAEELSKQFSAGKIERIIHGRMPLFTMEHCLWRGNLVKQGEPCHQRCRSQALRIRDRRGAIHTVRSDMFCRNFVENAEPIELKTISSHWQHLRIEWFTPPDNAASELAKMSPLLISR
jgi:putative protease